MISCEVVLDSISPANHRISTLLVTFPRWMLAEFNTHRAFSRNAASSRAIPVLKMIKRVQDNPFIPKAFGKNCKGMQQKELIDEETNSKALNIWKSAQETALGHGLSLEQLKIHKQYANRILEPFAYVTDIVTATDWENFFALRAHEAAAPEFQELAYLMLDKLNESEPQSIEFDEWHIPFADKYCDGMDLQTKLKVCTGRCARLSYLNHDGNLSIEDDCKLHDRLLESGHCSPFEHAAQAKPNVADGEYNSVPYRSGNFTGYVQYRKTIEGECRKDSRLLKKCYKKA